MSGNRAKSSAQIVLYVLVAALAAALTIAAYRGLECSEWLAQMDRYEREGVEAFGGYIVGTDYVSPEDIERTRPRGCHA
jgi:3-hydroxyisobutyrate dehydrogenase-like beta-hydroxyacid dehydrogenase